MGLISRVSSRTYRFLQIPVKMLQKLARQSITQSARCLATKVTVIPGDGIGPEVMKATKEVIKAVGAPVIFEEHQISEIQGYDENSINAAIESVKRNKVCMKGFILAGRSQSSEKVSLQMKLNKQLDTFAHVAHVHSYDGIKVKCPNVDFIVIRETTEGEYTGEEHEAVPGVVESLKVMTREKCERIARFAFDYALRHNRKKVTCVHKANIMKLGDGMFMRTCDEIAKDYPTIQYENMIVDNTCMQLVSNPWQFDVMVTPNLYGNIIGNLGAGLIGGAGVLPGAHFGEDTAFFGPGARYTHLSGTGRDQANPTSMFMAAGNMLKHIGLYNHGKSIRIATKKVIKSAKIRTKDIGGYDTLSTFTQEVISKVVPYDGEASYNYGNVCY